VFQKKDDGLFQCVLNQIVFEPFTRLDDSRDRKMSGVGLGPAIVNRILERHGGTVSISDNDGFDTRFVSFWPTTKEAAMNIHPRTFNVAFSM
jgi:signal transduction histidine kinase